jgi:outer membrane protein insertion porin family
MFSWFRNGLFSLITLLFTFTTASQALAQGNEALIEEIEFRGNRRIPRETLLYAVQSKPGDIYREEAIRRDLAAIVNLDFINPMSVRLFVAAGPKGGKVIIFDLREYPVIRDIKYLNLKAVTESEALTRFKDRRVNIGKEAQFDPHKVFAARQVLKELLAEKGYPEAEIEIRVEEISATAVALDFEVKEGPRFRVREIEFVGQRDGFSQRQLRGSMKLVKEAGLFTTFTSKDIYSREKLIEDLERVRFFLGTKGFLMAKIGEPAVARKGEFNTGIPLPVPGIRKKGPGLKITIPIEVGRRYRISKVNEKGVTIFQPGTVTEVSGLKVGEIVDTRKIQENVFKGIKELYGAHGYIQAEVNFIPKFIDSSAEEGEIEIMLEVDEGRQFTLRRLEFIGNTVTRDRVLRREALINEGDTYNKRSWDLSLLRLNQLGLFEEIKDKDAIARTNDRDQTVDIDLQVRERGREQIHFDGGISGYAGSFFGVNYSNNNLLGYGQTLTASFSGGNRLLAASLGYTEPYLFGKPIRLSMELFAQRQKYFGNGSNLFSSYYNPNLSDLDSLFTQNSTGGSIGLSAPLQQFTRRLGLFSQFSRVGVSYSLAASSVDEPEVNRDNDTSNDIPVNYSYPRILTSRITPNLFYNTLNSAIDPTRGQSLYLGLSLSGGILGGDINTISPSLEYKFFKPVMKRESGKPQVFGMRFSFGHVGAFGQLSDKLINTQSLSFIGGTPITERYFLGGENEVRGYNAYSISPVARYDSSSSTGNGNKTPTYVAIGGDTRLLLNMEYRISVVGPLSLAWFMDAGAVFNLRKYEDQVISSNLLRLSEKDSIARSMRASVGAELRIQVPIINVPFRLIFAYNPNANPDITDPRVLSTERRTVIRFTIGRAF